MIDVDEMRTAIIRLNGLIGTDESYTFHYDETNNIRLLRNNPDGFNVREPKVFVLGGIVVIGPPRQFDEAGLRSRLQVGSDVPELKFSQIGNGKFLDVLKSAKVETLLRWLATEGVFLHFQALDVVYWALVDVIDSILAEADEPGLYPLGLQLKDDLYTVLRGDALDVAEFLRRYDFPNVGPDRRRTFLDELSDIARERQERLTPFRYQMLKGVLEMAKKLDALPFIERETPNLLLGGFSAFYVQRIILFKNSRHVLDIEETIMERLEAQTFVASGEEFTNHAFVDSRTDFGIQIADAVVGLLGRLFTYANQTPIHQIIADKETLSDRQRVNLGLLSAAIDRSIKQNAAFASYVICQSDRERMAALLS